MRPYTLAVRLRSPSAIQPPRTLCDSDVFVAFLCLYLLTAARTPPFGDAVPMWEAAENLVRYGSFAIDTRWPVNAPVGVHGRYYPVAALLACLVHVPGALLQVLLSSWSPTRAASFVAVTSQLGPIVLGALTPTLFFRMLRQEGYDRRAAGWTTLLLGAGTPRGVYAHRPYSEIVQAACFVAFLSTLLRAAGAPTRGSCLRLGLAVALLVNAKNVYFACLPGALFFLCHRWFRQQGRRPRAIADLLAWVFLGLLPGLVALGWYNLARWGFVTSSGYGSVTTGFWNESVWVGLWGQFLSPGKSIFLYAPPLLLSLFGVRRLWSRRPDILLAMTLVVGPVVVLYARYLFWSGDWGWGPRYLVFAMPAFLMPAAELFTTKETAAPAPPRPRGVSAVMVPVVLALGIAVQGLGNAFNWDDYINIARQAQRGWLGQPDTRGTVLAPYPCFSCFEEVYPIQWLPPMQPIGGHWWLLRHKLAGSDWQTAAADAPWTRYTSARVDIQASYEAAGVDWWALASDPGRRWAVILIAFLLLLAIPLRPWLRALRRHESATKQAESPNAPE